MKLTTINRNTVRVLQGQAKRGGRTTHQQIKHNGRLATGVIISVMVIGFSMASKPQKIEVAEVKLPVQETIVHPTVEKVPEPAPEVAKEPVVVDTAAVLQEACATGREYRSMVDNGDARHSQAEYEAQSYADYVSSETGVSRGAIYNQVRKGLWMDACY